MASQLNFNRKTPSEIKKMEAIAPVETMKTFQNAHVGYDGCSSYILWRTKTHCTKAVINEKKLGISKVYVSNTPHGRENWKEVSDPKHVGSVFSAVMKLFNTKLGLVWFVNELNTAKRLFHANACIA